MADVYVATPTQADYDALMRLAEAAGYVWINDCNPTGWNNHWDDDGWLEEKDGTVIELDGNYLYLDSVEHVASEEHKIETILNLAGIKAIWKVSRENRDAFTMRHRLPPHYKSARKLYIICDEYSGTYTTKENEIYDALAVEYKPKESEVMPEKVKLPKFMCDWLDQHKEELCGYPMVSGFSKLARKRDIVGDVGTWLFCDTTNQWKLIDALRYGYEAEPEPRWGIKAGHSYLYEPNDKSFGPDEEPFSYSSRYDADQVIVKLGFGEVVDLNKEGKADD